MTTYEKLTVERFEQNLTEGKYESLTGARRAIGKTSSWSAKEKERAQAAAASHFGEEAPAPKTAKKAAAKPGKGPAKKAAAKGVAKTATAVTAATAAPKKSATKSASAATNVPKKSIPARQTSGSNGTSHAITRSSALDSFGVEPRSAKEAIELGGQIVTFAGSLREQVHLTKGVSPNLDMGPVMTEVSSLLLHAGKLVSGHVTTKAPSNELPAARLSVGSHGHTHAQLPAPTANLTAEEQQTAERLANSAPMSSIGALPRPVSQAQS